MSSRDANSLEYINSPTDNAFNYLCRFSTFKGRKKKRRRKKFTARVNICSFINVYVWMVITV